MDFSSYRVFYGPIISIQLVRRSELNIGIFYFISNFFFLRLSIEFARN